MPSDAGTKLKKCVGSNASSADPRVKLMPFKNNSSPPVLVIDPEIVTAFPGDAAMGDGSRVSSAPAVKGDARSKSMEEWKVSFIGWAKKADRRFSAQRRRVVLGSPDCGGPASRIERFVQASGQDGKVRR
jgi:hypothetical protein